jgi:hypothetical protein
MTKYELREIQESGQINGIIYDIRGIKVDVGDIVVSRTSASSSEYLLIGEVTGFKMKSGHKVLEIVRSGVTCQREGYQVVVVEKKGDSNAN